VYGTILTIEIVYKNWLHNIWLERNSQMIVLGCKSPQLLHDNSILDGIIAPSSQRKWISYVQIL